MRTDVLIIPMGSFLIPEISDRRKKYVLNFISSNYGCNKQSVVAYFDLNEDRSRDNIGKSNLHISRKTVYRIIDELVDDSLIREERERTNSRDIQLYVNSTNLLVTVPKELDRFESDFVVLLDTMKKKIAEKNSSPELLYYTLNIFSEVFIIYISHALRVWPKLVKNEGHLNKLYHEAFSRIYGIYLEILSRFRSINIERISKGGIDHRIPSDVANALLSVVEFRYDILSEPGLSNPTNPLFNASRKT